MKITVLIENTAQSGFSCEHGLSLFIEHEGMRILLDAGTTGKFAENADILGIDLSTADMAVLSHGHYDHSGGFAEFFRRNRHAKVWARREITGRYWSASGGMHEIGVPENVLAQSGRFAYISGNIKTADGVYLIGHSTPGLDKIGEKTKLYRSQDEEIIPDDFAHEQSLVIDTKKGLVIFNSCSHGGVANIISEAEKHLAGKPVFAYIGGFHMKGKSPDGEEICAFSDAEVDALCDSVRTGGLSRIYTGHCTGQPGFEKIKARLGEKAFALTTGMTIEI